jgi:hypothetical protein
MAPPIQSGLGLSLVRGGRGLSAPVNLVAPSVTGFAYPQETLTSSIGTWLGYPAPSFTYQWFVNSISRVGATASTFQPLLTDIGLSIFCRVTATNSAGSSTSNSNTVTCWHPNQIASVARFWSARSNVLNSVSPDVAATNDQTVRRWTDVISGATADQTVGSDQPIYRATGQSSGPSLQFDGTNDRMTLSGTTLDVFRNVGTGYIFVGFRDTNRTGGTNSHVPIEFRDGTNTKSRLTIVTRSGASDFRFSAVSVRVDNGTDTIAYGSTSDDNYNVLTAEALYSSGVLNLRRNGSQDGTANFPASGNTSNTASSNATICNISNLSGFYAPGHITSIICANQLLSATNRSRIERYIGLMGGLNIPLV